MPTKIDYTGKKYGNITLIGYSRGGGPGVGALWMGRCDCGKQREFVARHVANGRIQTCGECQLHRDLLSSGGRLRKSLPGRLAKPFRTEYLRLMREAARTKHPWTLKPAELQTLMESPCRLCGDRGRDKLRSVFRMNTGAPYTLDYLIPICSRCRKGMRHLNPADFLDMCTQVANHIRNLLASD